MINGAGRRKKRQEIAAAEALAEVYPPKEGLPAEGGFTRRRRVYPPKEGLPSEGGSRESRSFGTNRES